MCRILAIVLCVITGEEAPKEVVPIAVLEYGREYDYKQRCKCLTNDYGYFINWVENEEPELYVYQKKPARIARLKSMDELLAWAKKLPEASDVDWITTCGSTRGGVPQEKLDELQRIFTERKIHLTDTEDGNFTICICESIRQQMFTNIKEAREWMKNHPDAEYRVAGRRFDPLSQRFLPSSE